MSVSHVLQLLLNERNRTYVNNDSDAVDTNDPAQSSRDPEAGVHLSSNPFFSGNGMKEENNQVFNVQKFQNEQLNNPK